MSLIGDYHAKVGQRNFRSKEPAVQTLAGVTQVDPVKALVMANVAQLVEAGLAAWGTLDNHDIELRFNSGETFILANEVIIRIA